MAKSKAIQYFNDNAEQLSAQYNALDRAQVHADLLQRLPAGASLQVLDIGAGSGADASLFARRGHQVVATEPAKKLRDIANKTFKNKNIKWKADVLPQLKSVTASGQTFDVIYSVGVFQYLNKKNRARSLKKMVSLLKEGGLVEIQYPTPASRVHQFSVGMNEIKDFVAEFNRAAKDGTRLNILQEKNTKDFSGRKALDGSELYFSSTIIQRTRPAAGKHNKP